jgi:hypothetical protein
VASDADAFAHAGLECTECKCSCGATIRPANGTVCSSCHHCQATAGHVPDADAATSGTSGGGGPAAAARLCVGHLRDAAQRSWEYQHPLWVCTDGEKTERVTDVCVDRRTALGNPFPMENAHDDELRTQVCDACEEVLAAPQEADVDAIATRYAARQCHSECR